MSFILGEHSLNAETLFQLASSPNPKIIFDKNGRKNVEKFYQILQKRSLEDKAIYGVNTGFGILASVKIDNSKLSELQLNLIRSHACAVGEEVSLDLVRALLILKAHNFIAGHSGVSVACVELILKMLEFDILPVVYSQGSVGASGDLAPLAHIALALIGEGDVYFKNKKTTAKEAFTVCNLKPISLGVKEGLALINGTHFMSVLASKAVALARCLAQSADVIAALSLDALRGSLAPFNLRVQGVKKQPGQTLVARNFLKIFSENDSIMESHKLCTKVQDPYSLRCIPQVHGAVRGVLEHVSTVVDNELNSITDNPLVFEDGQIISGGNFHGEALAMAMDYLCIAVSEIGSISERRIEKLTKPQLSQQPVFLTKSPGLSSGFMIPQTVAAALASENKVLCNPSSVDSIPTNVDQEDHVSMGPFAGRKLLMVLENSFKILAIEALAAAQGIDLLDPLKPTKALLKLQQEIRKISAFVAEDRSLSKDIMEVASWIKSFKVLKILESSQITIE